jgi:tetratricopeptide (TPR) repeat protein
MSEDVGALIVLRPRDYLGYALRAIVQREAGQFAPALKDHTRAITLCSFQDELPRLYDQRRETYMRSSNYKAALEDAHQCAALRPSEPLTRFPIFTALLALGEYDAAEAELKEFPYKSMAAGYVLEQLSTGQPLVLPVGMTAQSPFFFMQQAVELHTQLKEKGTPLPMSSEVWLGDWSPDGHAIAYARYSTFNWQAGTLAGIASKTKGAGSRGLNIMDLRSGKARLLTRFGMYPVWSPDGKHIAFTSYNDGRPDVWLVSATGGQPHKLVPGYRAHWSRDSKRVLFRDRSEGTICSLAIDQPNAEPVSVLENPGHYLEAFSLSPDERLIAIEKAGEIRVLTFPDGQEVTRWEMPWPLVSWTCQLQWHPDCKTILVALHGYGNQAGICLFNIERAEESHVFNVSKPACKPVLSLDGSRLMVSLDCIKRKLWLLDIDPQESLAEVLAPCLTRDEFLASLLDKWSQVIEADASNAKNYVSRALVHLAAKEYKQAGRDLKHGGTLINDADDPVLNTLQFWAEMYFKSKRYPEAELLALQTAQLAERFPERFRNLPDGEQHPFRQLALIHAVRRNKAEAAKWWQKHAQVTARATISGSMRHDGSTGTYTLMGSGTDIGKDWDEFHFAFKRLRDTGSIIAKIERIEHLHDWTKAGVMIRNSLEPGARNSAVLVTPSGRATFQYRTSDFQETVGTGLDPNSIELPHWVKLERRGNSFTAHHSADGLHWEDITVTASAKGSCADIEMNDQVYIGLAVTSSAGPDMAAQAEFANVRVTGAVTPAGPFTVSRDIGLLIE